MLENVRGILQKKRAALLLWVVLLIALFWGYERLMYPLDRNTDLSAYVAECQGVDCVEIDRAEARGVTVLLLDEGEADENLAAVFPRSLLFSRYGSEAAFLTVRKTPSGYSCVILNRSCRCGMSGWKMAAIPRWISPACTIFLIHGMTRTLWSSASSTGADFKTLS